MKNYFRVAILFLAIAASVQSYLKSTSTAKIIVADLGTSKEFPVVATPGPGI